MKRFVLVITALLIASAWSVSYAEKKKVSYEGIFEEPGQERMEARRGPRGDRGPLFFGEPKSMKKKLGLTDEQVDQIGNINTEYRKKLLKIREVLDPKMIKLQRLLIEDTINLKDVRALLQEISESEVEIRMLKINHVLDIEKVLSSEQKKQFRNIMLIMMGSLQNDQPVYFYMSINTKIS